MYVEDISSRCVAARSFIFVWHCLENVLNSTILDSVQRTNWFFGIWTWHWILGDSDKLLFSIAILWFIPAHHLPIWIPISVANDSAIVFSPNSLNLGAFFLLLWSHNCTWGTWRNKFQMIRGSDWKLSADPYPYLHNPPIRDCVS